ncbi:hypothetical protein D3Y59_13870 [Hymenobacter oligotrophus]|uniref:ABC transporter ATPase n=1 Tax=Hymenobacter oligotrophus TaxID=2319843 RepID=A0A3B7RAG4_9BACT|nr:hypothetical protein [Hymenobacter oligotrophus]AYA38031.1 hypothetical protein D3Y59_13870 [Hymenobacter oligotrophus]
MFVPFHELPPSARIWIYQASRPLTEAELAAVQPALRQFSEAWTSHGRELRASAEFRHRQFLVIGLDEAVADASGCSIDSSVRFVRELEAALGLQLLAKEQLAFLGPEGQVQLFNRRDLKQAVADGALQPNSLYFDNTISQRGALEAGWPAPASATWLARYFGAA